MKISLLQLSQHLSKQLASIYLISGDEILLVNDTLTAIKNRAAAAEFSTTTTLHVDAGFNWQVFAAEVNNYSIFSEKTIIELRLSAKPNASGQKILNDYLKNPAADKLVIIVTEKMDAATLKSNWVNAIDHAGVIIQIWPIDVHALPGWIISRLKQAELKTSTEGVKIIADFTAGNLLAAAQEIEKLRLIYGPGELTTTQILNAIADNARFNIYELVDAALQANPEKVSHMLANFNRAGFEPILILWAIARELRNLISIADTITPNNNLEQALQTANVWSSRKALVKKALQIHTAQNLKILLEFAGSIDLTIKGAASGNVWQKLELLCLALTGINLKGELIYDQPS
ncbi:MAG: DNA polymerase III subunit delta [Gammaproteobacteria bacterium]|nr:DNA polymerase III subunit delta [Gammaproteobacteria bacterium]